MSDYYTEQLVKKKPDMKDMMTKAILIAVTIVSILAVLYYPIIIMLQVLLIILNKQDPSDEVRVSILICERRSVY